MYTVQFLSEDESEFERFYAKFRSESVYNEDFERILSILGSISERGALERYFRPEGRMGDGVCALPVTRSRIRLYCLRLSDRILILGNGGVKNTRTYEDDSGLRGHVLTLQKFDRLVREGVRNGTVRVTEGRIVTDKTFDI